ncbi:MAG: hypothetical protein QOD06_2690 [Candidatus Binatota bacterium]|nr:hypothetical protein [Candidatus Binatota bacterium]
MAGLPKTYFERLVDMSPDIIIAADRAGRIVFYNDGAEETLGYASEELLGQHVTALYPTLEEARRVMAAMRSPAPGESGKVKNFETELTTKSGERIPVAISGSIIADEQGRVTGSIGFAKDLRQIRSRDQLATLGELAVSLAHEINNPLEAIGNNLELMARLVASKCSDEEFVVEGERLEAIQRDLQKIQNTLRRIQGVVTGGKYGTREYLPGRLMTDLGPEAAARAAESIEEAKTFDRRFTDRKTAMSAETRGGPLQGVRILIVDDDAGVCHSIRDILKEESAIVLTANGGLEALRVIEEHPVDVVLSDVVMPDMDGYDLYMELKNRLPGLPVVLMTAYYFDKDHVIKRSRIEGLEQVIFKKPIDTARLRTILLDALKRTAAPETENAAGPLKAREPSSTPEPSSLPHRG